jgi:predicted transcriptional regulator YdeE
MQKKTVLLEEIKLVGIKTITNNAHIFEADPSTNKIAATVQQYFYTKMADKIPNRKNPGTTFCAYTDYESDYNGEYTFFIGEEVSDFDEIDESLETLVIPMQNYAKFTNKTPTPMPDACINMWKKIWEMSASDLGGERAYITDFEIYDERSRDHNNVTLDIYIGIQCP